MAKPVHLFFYDKDFKILDVLKDFSSLRWVTRWWNIGEFEIHADEKYMELFQNAVYVGRRDSKYVGMIEQPAFETKEATKIWVKGAMLERKLDERAINYSVVYSGNAETVMRNIVNDFFINPTDPNRKMAKLKLGVYNNLGGQVRVTPFGKSALIVLQEIALEQKLSFNMHYDYLADTIYFDVLQGLDRSQDQNINAWCIFSSKHKNVLEEKYEKNKFIKNYFFVEGGGEGVNRVKIVVDVRTAGEDLKEKYIDAKHLQQGTQTMPQYLEVLRQWGLQKAAEFGIIETVELKIDPTRFIITSDRTQKASLPVFGLGDNVTWVNEKVGFEAEAPVVELTEIIEPGANSMSVTLGREALTIKSIIKRGDLQRD